MGKDLGPPCLDGNLVQISEKLGNSERKKEAFYIASVLNVSSERSNKKRLSTLLKQKFYSPV